MEPTNAAPARALNLAPTNDEAHGTPHAEGPKDQQSQSHFAPEAGHGNGHLEKAWRLERKLNWPATLNEAMADPIRNRLVRLRAARLAKAPTIAARGAYRPATPLRHYKSPVFDAKRAAAGDRDD